MQGCKKQNRIGRVVNLMVNDCQPIMGVWEQRSHWGPGESPGRGLEDFSLEAEALLM